MQVLMRYDSMEAPGYARLRKRRGINPKRVKDTVLPVGRITIVPIVFICASFSGGMGRLCPFMPMLIESSPTSRVAAPSKARTLFTT